jgi:hypothetical protein
VPKSWIYEPRPPPLPRRKRQVLHAANPDAAIDRHALGRFLAALVLDRKKLAAFSAAAGRFLPFPIGDRRGTRMRASASKRR